MYKRIVVPLDGSTLAEQILPVVKLLASAFHSEVQLLHVVEPLPGDLALLAETRTVQTSAEVHRRVEAYLETRSESLKQEGVSAVPLLTEGNPIASILEEAQKEPGTLIAMTTHGRSGLLHWVLGGVTERVLQASTNPLLILRSQQPDVYTPLTKLDSVIVPLDGSDQAEQVLPHVSSLSQALGLSVTLVRATPISTEYHPFLEPLLSLYGSLSTQLDEQAAWYLYQVSQQLREKGVVHVEERVLHGHPAVAIIDLARGTAGNLVVMASQGYTGSRPWRLGGVTSLVAKHSGDPVLVIPTSQQE